MALVSHFLVKNGYGKLFSLKKKEKYSTWKNVKTKRVPNFPILLFRICVWYTTIITQQERLNFDFNFLFLHFTTVIVLVWLKKKKEKMTSVKPVYVTLIVNKKKKS